MPEIQAVYRVGGACWGLAIVRNSDECRFIYWSTDSKWTVDGDDAMRFRSHEEAILYREENNAEMCLVAVESVCDLL